MCVLWDTDNDVRRLMNLVLSAILILMNEHTISNMTHDLEFKNAESQTHAYVTIEYRLTKWPHCRPHFVYNIRDVIMLIVSSVYMYIWSLFDVKFT